MAGFKCIRSVHFFGCIYVMSYANREMSKDANKLCLDELCRAISFSGGFLGNKDVPHNAKLIMSASVMCLHGRREEGARGVLKQIH